MKLIPLISQIAQEEGVDPHTAHALYYNEADAEKGLATTWGDGGKAYGPMQLHAAAADEVGVDRFNVRDNIRGGIRYYKKQLDKFGNPLTAAVAYNRGPVMAANILAGKAPEDETSKGLDYATKFRKGLARLAGISSASAAEVDPTKSSAQPQPQPKPSPVAESGPSLERLYQMLDAADAAGNEQDAQDIAAAIRERRRNGQDMAPPPIDTGQRPHDGEGQPSSDRMAQLRITQPQPVAPEPPSWGEAIKLSLPGADEVRAAGAATGDWLARHLLGKQQGSDWSTDYNRALTEDRVKQGMMTTGQQIAGGLLTAPLIVEGNAANAATRLGRVGRSILAGGGVGGLYGFAGGEGGLENRGEAAITPAAVGAGIGAAAPLVGAIASKVGASVPKISRRVESLLGRSGLSADDVAAAMRADPLMTTAEALGEPGKRMGRAVAGMPGESGKLATDVLTSRSMDAGERILDSARKSLGDSGWRSTFDDLVRTQQEQAGPMYAAAKQKPVEFSTTLEELSKRPAMRQAMTRARQTAENLGHDSKQWFAEILDGGKSGKITKVPDAEQWHFARQELDGMLERYRDTTTGKLHLDSRGYSIKAVRDALDAELKPVFRDADAIWSGAARAKDAMVKGQSFLRGTPDDIAQTIKGMSESELKFYLLGVADALERKIGSVTTGNDVTRGLAGVKNIDKKIHAVFPGQTADDFVRLLSSESEKQAFKNYVLSGSRTAPMQQDIADLAGSTHDLTTVGDIAGAIRGNPWAIGRLGTGIMNRWTAPMLERSRNELGRLLFSQDPNDILAAARLMEAQRSAQRQYSRNAGRMIGAGGAATAGSLMSGR